MIWAPKRNLNKYIWWAEWPLSGGGGIWNDIWERVECEHAVSRERFKSESLSPAQQSGARRQVMATIAPTLQSVPCRYDLIHSHWWLRTPPHPPTPKGKAKQHALNTSCMPGTVPRAFGSVCSHLSVFADVQCDWYGWSHFIDRK